MKKFWLSVVAIVTCALLSVCCLTACGGGGKKGSGIANEITTYERVNEDGTSNPEGDYVLYGYYPKSSVTEASLLDELNNKKGTLPTASKANGWTSYQYYAHYTSENDFTWYKDVIHSGNKYRAIYFISYRPSQVSNSATDMESTSSQDNNGYYIDTVYWFKFESIKWKILSEDSGIATLFCTQAIDAQHLHTVYSDGGVYASNYANSHLRGWLNGTFTNWAFSGTQKALLQTTTVDNSAQSAGNADDVYACENTSDKVFLLSYSELTNSEYGFNQNSDRKREITDYAKSQGGTGSGGYLLRSPAPSNGDYVKRVMSFGGFSTTEVLQLGGIVPALRIKL